MASLNDRNELEKGERLAENEVRVTVDSKAPHIAGRAGTALKAAFEFLNPVHIFDSKRHRNGTSICNSNKYPTRVRQLQENPVGFPRLACFLDSDEAFMQYRRFGTLFSRLMLHRQEELRLLENELREMDYNDAVSGNERFLRAYDLDKSRGIPDGRARSRPQLLDELQVKALAYADLLLKAKQLNDLGRPPKKDYENLIKIMTRNGGQLFQEESEQIYEKADMVTLRATLEHSWLDRTVERFLQVCRCRLIRFIFCSKESKRKSNDANDCYYDRGRIATFVSVSVSCMILIMLMLPVWLLYRFSVAGMITTSPATISVILVFTLVFSAVLPLCTRAKRHEILAASAGILD